MTGGRLHVAIVGGLIWVGSAAFGGEGSEPPPIQPMLHGIDHIYPCDCRVIIDPPIAHPRATLPHEMFLLAPAVAEPVTIEPVQMAPAIFADFQPDPLLQPPPPSEAAAPQPERPAAEAKAYGTYSAVAAVSRIESPDGQADTAGLTFARLSRFDFDEDEDLDDRDSLSPQRDAVKIYTRDSRYIGTFFRSSSHRIDPMTGEDLSSYSFGGSVPVFSWSSCD